ncbi:MAG: hypothetical protein Kow0092_00640 [Deferrisomatales bacterium]
MLYLSLCALAAAALGYEVLLLRVFSLALWHHLAATAIGLALLGYGASGTFLSLFQERLAGRFARMYGAGALLFGVSAPLCVGLSQRVPFNPLALVWVPGQWLGFAGVCLVLAVPFFLAGGCVGLALRCLGEDAPRLYGADLAGAGLGAVGVVLLLQGLAPAACLRVLAWTAIGAGLLASAGARSPARVGRRRRAVLGAGAAAGVVLLLPRPWIEPRMSPYKDLSRALQVQGARLLAVRWGPLGQVAAVASPEVPFRWAPGLSLACPFEVAGETALFLDGRLAGIASPRWAGEEGAYLDCLPSALPYRLLPSPKVLVLGAGGGAGVAQALRHGAGRVEAVEGNEDVIGVVRALAGRGRGVYDHPAVRVVVAAPRAFLAAPGERYDLVVFPFLSAGGPANEERYLFTVEALETAWSRLAPGGLLALQTERTAPPQVEIKLWATAVAALEAKGVADPGSRLVAVGSWSTFAVLVARRPLDPVQRDAVGEFCRTWGFDALWVGGGGAGGAAGFHESSDLFLSRRLSELLGPGRRAFFDRYKFFVAPPTDDRPYVHRFFRWRALPELLRARGRGGAALVEWSYLLPVASLVQAVAFGAVLIVWPLRRLRGAERGGGPGWVRMGLYFGGLGLGFLLVEVAALKRLTLLVGHPVYTTAGVLGTFLVFAGLGSWTGRRWAAGIPPGTAAGAVALLVCLMAAGLHFGLPHLVRLPFGIRVAASMVSIAPAAFCMGVPFPRAVTALPPRAVPWAWGVNGFASVWSAPLADLVAMHGGLGAVLLAGAVAYAVAAGAAGSWGRPREG